MINSTCSNCGQPTTPNSPCNYCQGDGCKELISSNCVIYQGQSLTDVGLQYGDSITNNLFNVTNYFKNVTRLGNAWLLNGNNALAGLSAEKFIGPITNFDFPIRTNNVERMRVFKTGEVGVGITASPLAKVHIKGTGNTVATANFITKNLGGTSSFELKDDGSIYRNSILYSVNGSNGLGNSVSWGQTALTSLNTGYSNTAIGSNAGYNTTNGIKNTFVGGNAGVGNTVGDLNTFIGHISGNGNTVGSYNTFIGEAAGLSNVTGLALTCLGTLTEVSSTGFYSSFAIGYGAKITGNRQGVFGSENDGNTPNLGTVTDFYMGSGVSITDTAKVADIHLHATGRTAGVANLSAVVQRFYRDGAVGTGSGAGGDVIDRTSFSGTAGATTQNSLVSRVVIVAQGKALTDATAVSLFEVALPTLNMCGGTIEATVRCTDGTDMQSFSQIITYAAVNKGGAYTTTITANSSNDSKAVSAGTIANTWTLVAGTNKVTCKLASDTSLTPSGTNSFVVYYKINNNSENDITVL